MVLIIKNKGPKTLKFHEQLLIEAFVEWLEFVKLISSLDDLIGILKFS